MVMHQEYVDCPNTANMSELVQDIRSLQIQMAEMNTGVQRDILYIKEALDNIKKTQDATTAGLSTLTVCASSIASLQSDSSNRNKEFANVKSKVEKHDTYFAIMGTCIIAFWAWVSGIIGTFFKSN